MKEKYCSKCGTVKPVSEFYKREKSNDGLQPYCKACNKNYYENKQKVYKVEKIGPDASRKLHLKRLSTYHLNHGLEYKIKGKIKKHHYRNLVTYKCLTCGKEFTTDLDTAWSYRYNCEDCVCLIPGLPTNDLVRPESFNPTKLERIPQSMPQCANHKGKKVHEEISTATWKSPKCDCENHCSEHCEENECLMSESLLQQKVEELNKDLTSDAILKKIEELRKKIHHRQAPILLVIEMPKEQKVQEPIKKEGFWTKIKKLFYCS